MSFFNELKRRNVFKVGIAYIIMAWLVMQVADVILNNIVAPGWVFHVLLLFLAVGFPFAIFFAWAFELTPDGLKREHQVDRSQSITHKTSRKLDFIIIGALVVVLGYFAYDKLVLSIQRDAALVEATTQALTEQAATEEASNDSSKSIAVLPFVNMSSDPEQEYFSDGISEELLNLLAKIPDFRVAGRTSSFEFKGENRDLRKIGKSLGVANILEGSVRKGSDNVRISAQLVKVDDGFHLWSETYDRKLDNIFAVQDEIAGAVVSELRLTLLGESFENSSSDPIRQDATAHNTYLQGLFFLNKGGPENYRQAAHYFEQAVVLTPESALAWAGLASASSGFAGQAPLGQAPPALARARVSLARAQALDSEVPEVQLALADIKYSFDLDWEGAEVAARRALELRPGDVPARLTLASVIGVHTGRLDESLAFIEETFVLDPLDQNIRRALGVTLYGLGRFQEAEQAFRLAYDADSSLAFINVWLGFSIMEQGRLEEALPFLVAEPVDFGRLVGLAFIYYRLGDLDSAAAAQQELFETYGDSAAYQQANIYTEWGDQEKAIEWLNRAYEARDAGLPRMANDIGFKELSDHPGFRELLVKMNLAD